MKLSILMITRNNADVLLEALKTVDSFRDELLVGDGGVRMVRWR